MPGSARRTILCTHAICVVQRYALLLMGGTNTWKQYIPRRTCAPFLVAMSVAMTQTCPVCMLTCVMFMHGKVKTITHYTTVIGVEKAYRFCITTGWLTVSPSINHSYLQSHRHDVRPSVQPCIHAAMDAEIASQTPATGITTKSVLVSFGNHSKTQSPFLIPHPLLARANGQPDSLLPSLLMLTRHLKGSMPSGHMWRRR